MSRRSILAAAVGHVRDPLNSQSHALIAGNLAAGALSFAFWAIAARLSGPIDVGLASASVSTARLVGSFANLGLGIAVIRVLKQADTPVVLINSVGLVVAVVSLGMAVTVRVLLAEADAELSTLAGTADWSIGFVLLAVNAAVFPLVASVLLALGQSFRIVLVQLLLEGMKALALIVWFSVLLSATGIVFAAACGTALAVTPFLSRLITRLSAREAGW